MEKPCHVNGRGLLRFYILVLFCSLLSKLLAFLHHVHHVEYRGARGRLIGPARGLRASFLRHPLHVSDLHAEEQL